MNKKKLLSGIKPTGIVHLGNYFGYIQPALKLVSQFEHAQLFIADVHTFNSLKDPALLSEYTYQIVAAYLACGLDTAKTLVYRQSDVPETFELCNLLMNFTEKGLMNRAHSYKAKLDQNEEMGKSPDEGVNMGLFNYPILMAADILLFDPDVVPVGKDQLQHLEMARDIAQHFNSTYKTDEMKLFESYVEEEVQTIVGLDGRKMSKSYNNTIPLFAKEDELKKLIMKIPTSSQGIEEPKETEGDVIFTLYSYVANEEEKNALAQKYRAGGMGWGEAKNMLFEKLNSHIAPMREKYEAFMQDREYLKKVMVEGGEKAREYASAKMKRVRTIVGLDL